MDKERKTYEVSSQMSIEFEVDGPYKVGGRGEARQMRGCRLAGGGLGSELSAEGRRERP